MNIYCIYDNLYEEYQQPFTMKNDNIAKIEFDMFVNSTVEKAPEKEKAKTKNRFLLCKFNKIIYDNERGRFQANIEHPESKFTGEIHYFEAEPMTTGEENE